MTMKGITKDFIYSGEVKSIAVTAIVLMVVVLTIILLTSM